MTDSRGSSNNVLLWVLGGLGCLVVGAMVAGVLLVVMGAGFSFFTLRQAEEVDRTVHQVEAEARQEEEAERAAEATRAAEAAVREAEAAREQAAREEAIRAQEEATDNDDPLNGLEGL